MKTNLEYLAEELGVSPNDLRSDAMDLLYMKIGCKPGDKIIFAGEEYEVAKIGRFPHGWMVAIYDEPPSFHVDWINPSSIKQCPSPRNI